MLKAVTPFFLSFLFILPLYSQLHDNVWLTGIHTSATYLNFGESRLDFSSWPPNLTAEDERPITMSRCGTAISNPEGELLFYTNCYQVVNRNNELMENGDSINLDFYDAVNVLGMQIGSHLPQGAIVLPSPASKDDYYIVHINAVDFQTITDFHGTHLLFSKIGMSEANGLGAVIEKNVTIVEDSIVGTGLTAVRHANGRDWWLLVFKTYSNEYYRVLLSEKGLQVEGVEKVDIQFYTYFHKTCFSPDGKKFAILQDDWQTNELKPWVEVFDFDRCTGTLSNRKRVQYGAIADLNNQGQSISFSPNSRFLFIFREWEIFQADLSLNDPQSSLLKIADQDGFVSYFPTAFGASQLASDGRIYINDYQPSNDYYHILHQPNELGQWSKLEQHAIQLNGVHGKAIPSHPNYRLGPLEGSSCDTLGLEKAIFLAAHPYPFEVCEGGEGHFEVTAFGTGRSYQWQVSKNGGIAWEEVEAGPHFSNEKTEYLLLHSIPGSFDGRQFRCVISGNASTETSRPATLALMGKTPTAQIGYVQDMDSLHFRNETIDGQFVTWYWENGDSTVGVDNPSRLFMSEGNHPVMMVATNACGTDTAWAEIEVGPLVARMEGFPKVGCAPLEVTYSTEGTSNRANLRNGFFPGGSPATKWFNENYIDGVITYNQPGTYDAELRVARSILEFDTIYLEDHITVLQGINPTAEIELQQNGPTVQLNAPFGLADNYTWFFSNGDTLSGQVAEYTFADPGLYQIQLATTNHCGTATGSVGVLVGEPQAAFTADQPQGCAPLTVQFENKTDFFGASYEWQFPGGQPATSTEEDPEVVYEESGIYEVVLIARADSLSDTLVQTAFVEVLADECPQANIFAQTDGLEITLWTDCVMGTNYTWLLGDGSAPIGTPGVVHQYGEFGTFMVTLLVEGPCGIDTSSIEVNIIGPNATDFPQQQKHVSLVPNPTSGRVKIISEKGFPTGADLKVFSALGAQVLEIRKEAWGQQEEIALDGLTSGVYFFRFESGEGQVQVGKLVVE